MGAYLTNIGTLICINAILAVTLNFILGYAGIFSVAHALFFGIGAYTAANVALHWTHSLPVAMVAAMATTAALSLVLAIPALRVRGEYFVAASLGLQVIGQTIFAEWKSVTGGMGGLIGIPPAELFGVRIVDPLPFCLLSLTCLCAVTATMGIIIKSSFGRSLKAIRDSESAAWAVGKDVATIKTVAVAISSGLAGIAGALYAFYISFVNIESFTFDTTVLVTAMVIIGGTGTFAGPLLGAVLLMLLPSALSYTPFLPQTQIGAVQQVLYGLAMVLLMIFRPSGLAGANVRRR
jgi:branched-chain amino acid transport system permease protein